MDKWPVNPENPNLDDVPSSDSEGGAESDVLVGPDYVPVEKADEGEPVDEPPVVPPTNS